MKPALKITLTRNPQGEGEGSGVDVLSDAASVCFQAFMLRIPTTRVPKGLEELLAHDIRDRIVQDVSSATRVTGLITYHGDHMSIDITFADGSTPLKRFRIRFDCITRELIYVSEISL